MWKELADLKLNAPQHNVLERFKNANTGHTVTSCGSCLLASSPPRCLSYTQQWVILVASTYWFIPQADALTVQFGWVTTVGDKIWNKHVCVCCVAVRFDCQRILFYSWMDYIKRSQAIFCVATGPTTMLSQRSTVIFTPWQLRKLSTLASPKFFMNGGAGYI